MIPYVHKSSGITAKWFAFYISIPARDSPVILLLHKLYQAVTVTDARSAYWIFIVNQLFAVFNVAASR
jgi:hypothetical protein